MLSSRLPADVGVGFKPQHFDDICETPGELGFIEVHAENYMGDGGRPHAQLQALCGTFALSVHGVGLSIGSSEPLDSDHLNRLKRLCERYQPASFSEHLAWSSHAGTFLNDLLPLPYTAETLDRVGAHIEQIQARLGRQMLLENPATYVRFAESSMSETAFLAELVRRTGCGLLLDINNAWISAVNHHDDIRAYLAGFPIGAVREIHLAGHHEDADEAGRRLLIDSHGSPPAPDVWQLYDEVIARAGPLPTLIEWDNDVPEWSILRTQIRRANAILNRKQAA